MTQVSHNVHLQIHFQRGITLKLMARSTIIKCSNSEQSDGNQVTNPTRDCYFPAILKPQGVKTGAEYENKGSDSD